MSATSKITFNFVKFILAHTTYPFMFLDIFSNLINLFVFTRIAFRRLSVGFYFVCLTVADFFQFITILFQYKANYFVIAYGCYQNGFIEIYILSYLATTVPFYSSWFSTFIALDRFVSIKSIKYYARISKKRFRWCI